MEVAELVLAYIEAVIWPSVVLVLSLTFRTQLVAAFARLTKAELPGGIALDFGKEAEEAKRISERVPEAQPPPEKRDVPVIKLTEANERQLELGLRASPSGLDLDYYRRIAEEDPNLALAGLRIELEVLAQNLAKGFDVPVSSRERGSVLLRKLRDQGAVTHDQFLLASQVQRLASAAVHGAAVSLAEAREVIDAAEVLARQYIGWLSWGFSDGWVPNQHE